MRIAALVCGRAASTGSDTHVAIQSHACAITGIGAVKCWGNNGGGQLGDESTTNSPVPVNVAGLDGDATSISMGYDHSCALKNDPLVSCWGSNSFGQLGNSTANPSLTPVPVVGLPADVHSVAAGDSWAHTCVASVINGVICWGHNEYGQLGNDSVANSRLPVNVLGLDSDVEAVAVGYYHSCALTLKGAVLCWGANYAGALGDGTTSDSSIPVVVDFVVRPSVVLRSSIRSGTIDRGTRVTFTTTVRPIGPADTQPTVRFVVNRRDELGIWRTAATRDVIADSSGRAVLQWGFVTTGERYVRSRVVSDTTYARSAWSLPVRYAVS